MPEPQTPLSATRTLLPAPASENEGRFYLLVLDGGASSFFHLPRTGVVLIGRVPEADLRLVDGSISRRHAKITVADGEPQVADLDSHNGTRVNGELVQGARVLRSGDVVAIGEVTLVLHTGRRVAPRRVFAGPPLLRQRLEEEVERALSYQRPLTVLVLVLAPPERVPPAGVAASRPIPVTVAGNPVTVSDREARSAAVSDRDAAQQAIAQRLRLIDIAGWTEDGHLCVLLPELPGLSSPLTSDISGTVMEALLPLFPGCHGGVATCPEDGCDADTLLLSARAAAQGAPAGEILPAGDAVLRLSMDGRSVLLADPAMLRLYDMIRRLARSDLPVLVTGETGAGKENAAYAVHHFSPRKSKPFVALNCAALAETLLESELFGYERGAFSGATHSKPGLLETAAGGTVFLDEVGELSASAQSKLLRALEQRRITRLGDVREREIDIRVVAATNRRLEEEVKERRFREDLFFRLSAATVVLPPLRERPREITLLAQEFLRIACTRSGRGAMVIGPVAMQRLAAHAWPGNVRELRNVMEYLAAALPDGTALIERWHLPEKVSGLSEPARAEAVESRAPEEAPAAAEGEGAVRPLAEELRELEQRRIKEALRATGGVRKRAAERIGMPLRTFVLRLKQFGLGQDE